MALTDITTRVNRNISNTANERFTSTDVRNSIQKAYNYAAVLTGAIQKSTTFPFPSDTPYINLRQQIPDYFAPIGIFNLKTHRWLEPTSPKELDLLRWDWERWTGEPTNCWFVVDFNRICILPYQTTGAGTFILWYLAFPPTLSDGMNIQLPSQHEYILAEWATGDLLDTDREYVKAAQFQNAFYQSLNYLEKEINNLAAYDKNLVLEPYYPLGRYGSGGDGDENVAFVDNITPTGTVDGTNPTFTIPSTPNPTASLLLMKNGQVLFQGTGYTLSGSTITYVSDYIPQTGDLHRVWYRT